MREKTGTTAVVMAFPVACAVAGFFTGCDKTPTGPTSGPPRVVADPAPPTPAFSLTGYVHEAGLMVEGARVEVTTGVGAPLTTLTDFWGRYVLRVVSGESTVRVTKDGYLPAAETSSLRMIGRLRHRVAAAGAAPKHTRDLHDDDHSGESLLPSAVAKGICLKRRGFAATGRPCDKMVHVSKSP